MVKFQRYANQFLVMVTYEMNNVMMEIKKMMAAVVNVNYKGWIC